MKKEEEVKTPYEWCVEANIRVLDINEWPLEWYGSKEKHFFEFPTMVKSEMMDLLTKVRVKPNSKQRKTTMYLEYRMYGFCNYQLSGTIHGGIQFGHCCIEYQQKIKKLPQRESIYNKWATKDKTFIILNGGTTNDNLENYGILQKNRDLLIDNNILFAEFREPDLNNSLTSICFLVDERVWNRDEYPDFVPETIPYSKRKPSEKVLLQLEERNNINYKHWVEKIGGQSNAFLREFLKTKKLL